MQSWTGNQIRRFRAIEPVSSQGMTDRGHVKTQLMGASGFREEPDQRKAPALPQDFIMGNGGGAIRQNPAPDGRGGIAPDGGVNGSTDRGRTSRADGKISPDEIGRVKPFAEQVMDIAAFGHDHQSGRSFIQPIYRVKNKVCATGPGQCAGHSRGIRQKIGGVGCHSGGFVNHQQMIILPDNRQRPVSGHRRDLWRAMVPGFHRQLLSAVKNPGGSGGDAVDQNAILCAGEPGDGMRGEVQGRLENVPDGSAVFLRADGFCDGFRRLDRLLSVISIAQDDLLEQREIFSGCKNRLDTV